MWFFRAVALDLDGTLAENDQLAETGIAASMRAGMNCSDPGDRPGFSDLEAAFPGLWREFDALVTENGAVLSTP